MEHIETKMYKAIETATAANNSGEWYRESINWKLARMYANKATTVTNRSDLAAELNQRAARAYIRFVA